MAAIGLSSCASPVERRITRNPQLFEKLSSKDRALVVRGEIREGMTKEAVFLAWGRADYISGGRDRGAAIDRWEYAGTRPVYTADIGIGFGVGHYHHHQYAYGHGHRHGGYGYSYGGMWDPYWGGYGGPSIAYVPYRAASVDFRQDRVVRFVRSPDWLN